MLVVDANVMKGYFDESVIEIPHTLSASALHLFDSTIKIALDDQDQISSEWKAVVDREWLDQWLAEKIRDGKILIIEPESINQIQQELFNLGFPRSRDIWYIKTAKGLLKLTDEPIIISEDIDFYDPTKKGQATGAARFKLMKKRSAPVRKAINKRVTIDVMCVDEYMNI